MYVSQYVYGQIRCRYLRRGEKMQRAKKITIGILAVLGAIFLIFMGIALMWEFRVFEDNSDEEQISTEYQPQNIDEPIDEESIPDSQYYSSPAEAMKNSCSETDPKQIYQKNIDEEIVRFENENYVSIYFRSVKDKNTECFTLAKFKKKMIGGEVKYTFLTSIPTEAERGHQTLATWETTIKSQLAFSDYQQNVNIDPEQTRFVFGDCQTEKIYNMKVEGQSPTGIIPYEAFGEQRYFWYYENLESDIAGSQLKFTVD